MANRCRTVITVQGPLEARDAFAAFVRGDALKFDPNRIIPEPQHLHGTELGKWRTEHWGASGAWNAEHRQWDDGDLYLFDTKWSTPWRLYAMFIERFPGLKFKWLVDIQFLEYFYLYPDDGRGHLMMEEFPNPNDPDGPGQLPDGVAHDFLHTLLWRHLEDWLERLEAGLSKWNISGFPEEDAHLSLEYGRTSGLLGRASGHDDCAAEVEQPQHERHTSEHATVVEA
jgi:hypothetical protein